MPPNKLGNADDGSPSAVTPKLALISHVDGLVLPIILVLGILALVYLLFDLAAPPADRHSSTSTRQSARPRAAVDPG